MSHPTPAQAFDTAVKHATLLRALFNHPQYVYLEPPTADRYPTDTDRTPAALLAVSDFVQTTYINSVIPFLPAGATRKCKAIANPWAYADPDYKWELEWDKASGETVAFPQVSGAVGKLSYMMMRGFMTRKGVLENATDLKARLLIGGQAFDFGDEVKRAVEDCYD